jgi:hypothetical protein
VRRNLLICLVVGGADLNRRPLGYEMIQPSQTGTLRAPEWQIVAPSRQGTRRAPEEWSR